ncbi:cobalamin biosynthesis protein [Sedimentitalea sp. HM32M-2]|uniref:cobalamin biosynthesis protein n=1 Tax=Sedimentitalea sp. HM32M-2 TaxID=3351566 RepID=UPI00363B1D7B
MEHRAVIVAGFGFRRAATCASLQSALDRALARAGQSFAITLLSAPADKAKAPCLRELARLTGLTVRAIPAAELRTVSTPTRSEHSQRYRDTGSVAEAAALAAAGPGARLLSSRHISEDRLATCAVAIKETT